MNCPECESQNWIVYDSRHSQKESIWRRRKCKDCGCRFTTREIIETVNHKSKANLLN